MRIIISSPFFRIRMPRNFLDISFFNTIAQNGLIWLYVLFFHVLRGCCGQPLSDFLRAISSTGVYVRSDSISGK